MHITKPSKQNESYKRHLNEQNYFSLKISFWKIFFYFLIHQIKEKKRLIEQIEQDLSHTSKKKRSVPDRSPLNFQARSASLLVILYPTPNEYVADILKITVGGIELKLVPYEEQLTTSNDHEIYQEMSVRQSVLDYSKSCNIRVTFKQTLTQMYVL